MINVSVIEKNVVKGVPKKKVVKCGYCNKIIIGTPIKERDDLFCSAHCVEERERDLYMLEFAQYYEEDPLKRCYVFASGKR